MITITQTEASKLKDLAVREGLETAIKHDGVQGKDVETFWWWGKVCAGAEQEAFFGTRQQLETLLADPSRLLDLAHTVAAGCEAA